MRQGFTWCRLSTSKWMQVLLLALALLLPSSLLFAEEVQLAPAAVDTERLYQVELLVFSHLNASALEAEQWPPVTPAVDGFANAVVLKKPPLPCPPPTSMVIVPDCVAEPAILTDNTLLPPTQWGFTREADKLQKQENYRVIYHQAWQQQVFPGKKMPAILVDNRVPEEEDVTADTSLPALEINLSGTAQIQEKNFFDLHLSLLFAVPEGLLESIDSSADLRNITDGYGYFRLQQTRRMRLDELNYIDHPLFGVLAKITRVPSAQSSQKTYEAHQA